MEKLGILSFCIAYGLIEASNAFYLFQKNKLSAINSFIIIFWGTCIFLLAIDGLSRDESILTDIDYFLFGTSWLFMIRTPCSAQIFHPKNKYGPLVRKIIFIFLSLTQFATILLKHI